MTTILLPLIGITDPSMAISMLEGFPNNFIGLFIIPGGYEFSEYSAPGEWINTVLKYDSDPNEEDESTAAVIDLIENVVGQNGHDSEDNMYLMFWIGILSNSTTPSTIDFVIQHVRTDELSMLLDIQRQHNIPTHTEVEDFTQFINKWQDPKSYGHLNWFNEKGKPIPLSEWDSLQWTDFCMNNFSEHGEKMYTRWIRKTFGN